jgi:hypothetical protein
MKFNFTNLGAYPVKLMTGSGSTPVEGENSDNGIQEVIVDPGHSKTIDFTGKVGGVSIREMTPMPAPAPEVTD